MLGVEALGRVRIFRHVEGIEVCGQSSSSGASHVTCMKKGGGSRKIGRVYFVLWIKSSTSCLVVQSTQAARGGGRSQEKKRGEGNRKIGGVYF